MMNPFIESTKKSLTERELVFDEFDDNTLGVGFSREDGSHLHILFQFDEKEDGEEVDDNHVHIFAPIENINVKEVYSQALSLCNSLNQRFRWCKFYVDDSYIIFCTSDAILSESNAGDVCSEIMARMLSIIDESMPKIRQLVEFSGSGTGEEGGRPVLS